MDKIKLGLINNTKIIKERVGTNEVYLDYHEQYCLGDTYRITLQHVPTYLMVQLDPSLKPALIYVIDKTWNYQIPFNIQREWPYPDGAFTGQNHYATVRYATNSEIYTYQNLAENSHDQHGNLEAYPHASSNTEINGKMVFYSRNAIDGVIANNNCGNYPYQAWEINKQEDAELKIDFGRLVEVDTLAFVLRADPHDGYWTNVTVELADGENFKLSLTQTAEKQIFEINKHQIDWLKLTNLKKNADSSTFPALTEIEAYGKNIQ